MSDFYINIDLLRGQVSDMLCDNEEQAMWVLAEVASRIDATTLHEHIDGIDADASDVAQFFRDLAELIEADLEAEAY